MSTMTAARPASQKQRDFIERLLAEKELSGTAYDGWTPDWSRATTKTASQVIDYLMTLPRRTASAPAEELQAGVYTDGTTYVRVYFGQQSGKMLAKTINFYSDGPLAEDQYVDYTYAGAAARVITPSFRRMTLEEVGAMGVQFNHCLVCGRRLDDPESVDRGIGPVCAKRY